MITPLTLQDDKPLSFRSILELAARQLVLGPISAERQARDSMCDHYKQLTKLDPALAVLSRFGEITATPLLMERQAEVQAKRLTFDDMAARLGKSLPTKPSRAPVIKLSYDAAMTTLKQFIEDGERSNAVEYADLIGKPLMFGKGPCVYYDCAVHIVQGITFFIGRGLSIPNFTIIELSTGLVAVLKQVTKTRAETFSALRAYVELTGLAKMTDKIAKLDHLSQDELRSEWLSKEGVAT